MNNNELSEFGNVVAMNETTETGAAGYRSLYDNFETYAADMKATPKTVVTGFDRLDNTLKINGFTMLGGASGAGKTSLCLNIALKRAEKGLKTVFYSLEMPVFALVNRLICIDRKIDYMHAGEYWQQFRNAAGEILKNIYFVGNKDLIFNNLPKFDTSENSELIKTIKTAGGGASDLLLIVDSLHLLPADANDVRVATNENVIKIRNLTDNYHISSIIIGQSKRGEKTFDYITDIYDKKNGVFDTSQLRAQFRESALIEYSADALFYLLNDATPPTGINTTKKWLCAVKNRITDTGMFSDKKIVGFEFNGENYSFTENYTNTDLINQCAADEGEQGQQPEPGKKATQKKKTKKDLII